MAPGVGRSRPGQRIETGTRRGLGAAGLAMPVLVVVLAVSPRPAIAHPAPFSYLDLRLDARGIDGALVVHDYDVAHDFGVSPPESLLDAEVAGRYRDGRPAPLVWTGFAPLPERQSLRLTFRAGTHRPAHVQIDARLFPYDPVHQTFLNVYEDGRLRHQAVLADGRPTADYYAGTWQGTAAVLGVFVPAGIEHILIGPDHVLFLVGLLLLGGGLWRLAAIVTAFTIGHSITLSLAALDVVAPPAAVIEPAIALSIVFVGADNLLVHRDLRAAPSHTPGARPRDIRPWIAAVFGLVHGFGFASVLKELGLPLTALGWSLFSFNLGVELGQLGIVLVVAAALSAVRRRSSVLARRLAVGGSVAVMAAGTYWFIERVFLSGGVT